MEQPAFSMSERQEGSANNPLEAREVPPRTVKHRGATARVAAFVNEAGRPVFMATIQGALDDLPDDVVTNALWYATKQGKVRRLDVGLYAPLDWTAPGINGNGMKVLGVTPEETREETQDDLCLGCVLEVVGKKADGTVVLKSERGRLFTITEL